MKKKNFFELNKLLDLLSFHKLNNINVTMNSLDILNNCLDMLINNGIFKLIDKKIYNAYIKDLIDVGYDFSFFYKKYINIQDNSNYKKIKPKFKLYIPSSWFEIKNQKTKLINHH